MFDKKTIIQLINKDLVCMRNRRYMSEYCTDPADKQAFWDGYVTALQIRDGRVDILNSFGYKPVYMFDQIGQICIDIVPLKTEKSEGV